MNIIRIAIERPIAVIAAVLMVVMFGLVALSNIPIQLTPDIRKPTLSVRTNWPGAAPAEVEREILNRQEDVLRGLEGLEEISGQAQTGQATVTLEFRVGQDMDKALLLVANATAASIKVVADATQSEGGLVAVNLKVAERFVDAFGNIAKQGNTMILPGNAADIAGLVATAMQVVKKS